MRPDDCSSQPGLTAVDKTIGDASAIGDANIERLLSRVYQPETPAADFVARVEQAVAAAAEARREAAAEAPTRATPFANGEILALRPWQILLGWAAAILVLVGTIALVNRPREAPEPVFVRDGDVVWHRGTPFVAVDVATPTKDVREPTASAASIAALATTSSQRVRSGITARLAPPPPKAKVAKIGETISTASSQRRVALPDGSLLHLDRHTSVAVEGPRQVRLLSGQAFVEVRPAATVTGAAKNDATDVAAVGSLDQRFVVRTPHRELTALGTKFAVKVAEKGTDLLVTQGKVQADAPQNVVAAGERLAATQEQPAAAPRLSHSLDWAKDLIASTAGALVPPSQYAGGSLVAKGPAGQEASLSLRKYHIDVHIEDGFARTTIDQTYFNHQPWRMEGTFFFPLPPDASLSRLAMYVGPTLMEGGMVERNYGRQVFESIKYRMLDPALLEWVDGSTFKMRVFPLEGLQEKRIILSYTQRLPTAYGRTQYRFPAGHSLESVRDWSLRVLVKGGASVPWECDSHALVPQNVGGDNGLRDLVLTAEAHDVKFDTDIVLALDEPQSSDRTKTDKAAADRNTADGDSPRFSTFEQDGWRYLMLRYRPTLAHPTLARRASEGESPPTSEQSIHTHQRSRRDWLFLFESSADRDPLLARAQIEIIRGLLASAEHDDTFNIVAANTRATLFKEQPQTATAENIAAAVEFMENTRLIGALDLQTAFAAAKAHLATEHPVLVHVGSGIPVLGQRQIDKLVAELPPQAAYVGVGVGKRWNRALMRQAASRSGGYVTQINPDEPLAWRALELLSTLNAPRLLDLQVQPAGQGAPAPAFLLLDDSLADGEELCAVTRVPSGPLPTSVRMTGRLVGRIGNPSYDASRGGGEFRREFPVGRFAGGAGYLPRTWAKQEIDRLVAADAAKNHDAIVALSKAMYVMSPFTSLLVLENDAMYAQYKVDRGRKDHWAMYPCPERLEIPREPLTAPPPDPIAPPSEAKPKPPVDDVLRSLLVRVPKPLMRVPHELDYSGTYAASAWFPDQDFGSGMSVSWADFDRPFQVFGRGSLGTLFGQMQETQTGRFSVGVGVNSDAGVLGNIVLEEFGDTDDLIRFRMRANRGVGLSAPGIFSADLDIPDGRGRWSVDHFDSLSELIRDTLRANSWREAAGPGSVEPFEGNLNLVISQTQGVDWLGDDFWAMNAFFRQTPRPYRVTLIDGSGSMRDQDEVYWENLHVALPLNATMKRAIEDGIFLRRPSNRYLLPLGDQDWGMTDGWDPDIIRMAPAPNTSPWQILSDRDTVTARLRANLTETEQSYYRTLRESEQVRGQLESVNSELQRMRLALQTEIRAKSSELTDTINAARTRPRGLRAVRIDKLIDAIRGLNHYDRVATVKLSEGDFSGEGELVLTRFSHRIARSADHRDLLYQAPKFNFDDRLFSDLLAFAPGMNTSWTDVAGVLEDEAELSDQPRQGSIDPAARALIDKARPAAWQTITWKDDRGTFSVACDGQGRYRYERTTLHGLKERVVCDGTHLWHLYPELGVGARRAVNRHHRAALASLVPWLVLPAEDYALGADVNAIGPNRVAIVPLRGDMERRTDRPRTHAEEQLTFAADGRLAERKIVLMPEGKPLATVTLAADGTVSTQGGDGKKLSDVRLTVAETSPPDLPPDLQPDKQLVILPLPVRSRDHVLATVAKAKGRPDGGVGYEASGNVSRWMYDDWTDDDVLRLLAPRIAGEYPHLAEEVIAGRFFARGDRRLGFYTLLLSAASSGWRFDQSVTVDGRAVAMNPLADHPDSLLAHYLARQSWLRVPKKEKDASNPALPRAIEPRDGLPREEFLGALTELRDAHYDRLAEKALGGNQGQAAAPQRGPQWHIDGLLDYARRCPSPYLAWAALERVPQWIGALPHNSRPYAYLALAARYGNLVRSPLAYAARYEQAACYDQARQYEQRTAVGGKSQAEARRLFTELFRDAVKAGAAPALDGRFFAAMSSAQADELIREGANSLVKSGRHAQALALAWQCRHLSQEATAAAVVDLVLRQSTGATRTLATAAAIEFRLHGKAYARANGLMESLLADERLARLPSLWGLAAVLADKQGQQLRAADCLEQAIVRLEMAYRGQAEIDKTDITQAEMAVLGEAYRDLSDRYGRVASAVVGLDGAGLTDLAARVMRVADRRREMEEDSSQACRQAAALLRRLGQREAAWDYLTTPLALRPGEAEPWVNLAEALKADGEEDLADRAYSAAFDVEGSNPQHLCSRAQLAQQRGRFAEAREFYRQIAVGAWPPQHAALQAQAKQVIGQ